MSTHVCRVLNTVITKHVLAQTLVAQCQELVLGTTTTVSNTMQRIQFLRMRYPIITAAFTLCTKYSSSSVPVDHLNHSGASGNKHNLHRHFQTRTGHVHTNIEKYENQARNLCMQCKFILPRAEACACISMA